MISVSNAAFMKSCPPFDGNKGSDPFYSVDPDVRGLILLFSEVVKERLKTHSPPRSGSASIPRQAKRLYFCPVRQPGGAYAIRATSEYGTGLTMARISV